MVGSACREGLKPSQVSEGPLNNGQFICDSGYCVVRNYAVAVAEGLMNYAKRA